MDRSRVYELMAGKYKRANGNLDTETKDDESKIRDSRISSQAVVDRVFKGMVEEPDAEQMLVSELKKFNIEPAS